MERQWYTLDNKLIPNFLEEVKKLVEVEKRSVIIGTDAQKKGLRTEYVTVVCLLLPGKGGRVLYSKTSEKRHTPLREKLFKEVWYSIETALVLNEVIPSDTEIVIHVDANPNVKFKSSRYVQELVGSVVSQGFKAVLKPAAFAASHAGDFIVKGKNQSFGH